MPTLNRRQWLAMGALPWLAPFATGPVFAGTNGAGSVKLLATWRDGTQERVGVVQVTANGTELRSKVLQQLELPGRAHGLLARADGSVIVLARRPGDWLLEWHPSGAAKKWHWLQGEKRLNGHAQTRDDGLLLTTETDQESGEGWIGLRDLTQDRVLAHWPSHGLDPHELLRLPQALGRFPAGTLMVANGGIPTHAETGRQKLLATGMDASLVAMDPANGRLLGQWRLPDERLSIRHLAWDAVTRQLGIALQAEHDDPAARTQAPVLATWNGESLQAATHPPLAGYGGSICARAGGGFIVSCTRANRIAVFDGIGHYLAEAEGPEACALASDGAQTWFGTKAGIARVDNSTLAQRQDTLLGGSQVQIDNHWLLLRVLAPTIGSMAASHCPPVREQAPSG